MNQFLHLLQTLETHMDQIRTDLGPGWPDFAAQMQKLAPAFESVQDETELARAVGDLYMACRGREPVMAILRRTADPGSAGGQDRIPAPQPASRQDIQGMANRFFLVVHDPEAAAARAQADVRDAKAAAGKSQGTSRQ